MSDSTHQTILKKMFYSYFAEEVISIQLLTPHASARKYFLLQSDKRKVIGVYGNSLEENRAFIEIQKQFSQNSVRVPELFIVHNSGLYYLQEYCGSEDLFGYVAESNKTISLTKTSCKYFSAVGIFSLKNSFSCSSPKETYTPKICTNLSNANT